MTDVHYSKEIDLKQSRAARDVYKYTKIYSNLNSGSVTLSANSNSEMSFEIPVKAMNLANSFLSYQFDATSAALGGGITKAFNIKGASMIQRISLQTRSGLYLCDLPYADIFTGQVTPATVKMSNVQNNGTMFSAAGAITTFPEFPILPISIDDSGSSAITGITTGNTFSENTYQINVAAGAGFAVGSRMLSSVVNGDSNLSTNFRMLMKIPLKTFTHTILALEKTMIFPEVIILRIVFNSWNTFSVHNAVGTPTVTSAATFTAMTISDCILNLAVSKDPIVTSQLQQSLSRGIEISCPYVHGNLQSLNTASQCVNLRYSSGYGQRLLCVYNVVMPGTANFIRYFSSSNMENALVTDYYTTIDSVRLQDSNLRSDHGEDYFEHEYLLDGSLLSDPFVYKSNRLTVDSFRAGRCCDWPEMDTVADGIPLQSNELTYSLFTTVPSTTGILYDRSNYTFAVVQKQLSISHQAISFV